jgi:hypothetical protein
MEGGGPRGAQIVAVDPKWALYVPIDTLDNALCETCDGDQIRSASLWLWARDSADRDVEKNISPEYVAELMMSLRIPLPNSVPTAIPCL